MSYVDRYVQGSFRGLKFFTEKASIKAGQRRAIYEIPFDDRGAASVDLGRKPRKFELTVFLLEQPASRTPQNPNAATDLDIAVKAFLSALEQPGAGLLIHPYLGNVMVLPDDDVDVDLSTAEGGKASIRFEAIESRAQTAQTPRVRADARAATVPRATAALRVENKTALTQRFSVASVSDFVRNANVNTLLTALQNLRTINGAISSVLAVPGELASQIDAISLQVVSLVDTPDKMYDTLASVIDSVYQSVGRVAGRFGFDTTPGAPDAARVDAIALSARSLKLAIQSSQLTAGSPPAGLRDTPPRARERQNRAALDQALQAAALSAIIDAANLLELPSKQENLEVRDLLLDALEQLFVQDLEAGVVDALNDVRAAVRARFTNATQTLVTTFTAGDDMPADVIAWQLYGDAERSTEIVERNDLPDPGQCPGLVELEVLND